MVSSPQRYARGVKGRGARVRVESVRTLRSALEDEVALIVGRVLRRAGPCVQCDGHLRHRAAAPLLGGRRRRDGGV